MDETQSANKNKEFENEGTKEKNVEKTNTEETDSNCDIRKGKGLSCGKCYVPKRYVTTAMTAIGMLLIYAMRTNLGVTVITILDHAPHTKVHENTVSDVSLQLLLYRKKGYGVNIHDKNLIYTSKFLAKEQRFDCCSST